MLHGRKLLVLRFVVGLTACGTDESPAPGDGDADADGAAEESEDGRESDGEPSTDGDAGDGSVGDGDGDGSAQGGEPGDGEDGACTAVDSNIYLVDTESKLWKLAPDDGDPASSALGEVGTLDCDQGPLDIARGLAIGSDGTAFVLMGDFTKNPWEERLYTLDLATAKCGETNYQIGAAGTIGDGESAGPFGLTMFRRDGAEFLLMNTQVRDPFAVVAIDPEDFTASPFLAGVDPGAGSALIGVGEGQLYGAFWGPPSVDAIDPSTGARTGSWPIEDSIVGFRSYADVGIAASPGGVWAFHLNADWSATEGHHFARDTGKRTDFELAGTVLTAGSAPCAAP